MDSYCLCRLSLLISFPLLFAHMCVGDVECSPFQRSLLLDLKNGFSSSPSPFPSPVPTPLPSSKLISWLPGSNCCNWEGVTCDALSGLVAELDLSSQYIQGKIKSSLFKLSSLRKLNLAYNFFNQTLIHSEFELLSNLVSLNLSNAGVFGQVPIGIAKLTKLAILDLSDFSWGELPPIVLENTDFRILISNMSKLTELYLDGVSISASGYELGSALVRSTPKLRTLSLSGCLITGPLDASMLKLHDLSVIRLDNNELNCSVPEFLGQLSSLKELNLMSCGLHGNFPGTVFLLRSLETIDLSYNPMLSGSLPGFFDDSRLETVVLSGTNFSGSLPSSIGKLKSLISLELDGCQFSGAIPSSTGELTQLVLLDLSQNNFTGSIPVSVGNLKQLGELSLNNNLLSGQVPSSLFALPSLRSLYLNSNQFSGQLQEFPDGSHMLEAVDLSNNMLQGEIPKSVFQLPGLLFLALSSNNFSGEVEFSQFSVLRNLSYLDLSHNRISIQDAVDNDSISFPMFGDLMLASCNLTGVPSFLRYQDLMSYLDLSNNNIHGEIPSWIWSTGSLNYLNLSSNFFTSVEGPLPDLNAYTLLTLDLHSNFLRGPIPFPSTEAVVLDYSNNNFSSSIPSNISLYLGSAIFFSVANNNLTGEIPPSICNASLLEVLDLSDNNLRGQIPSCLLEVGPDLHALNLGGNMIEGTIPHNLTDGCSLSTLILKDNRLEGHLPRSMANCTELEVLDLGNNHIRDSFPFWLGELHALKILVLKSNRFYGPVEAHSGINAGEYSFPVLQIFDISSNDFNGSLSSDCFKNMKGMMGSSGPNGMLVASEYLQWNPMYGSQYPLYHEDAVSVRTKGQVMTLVKTLAIFRSIDFSNNFFEGSVPDSIGDLASLKMLNLSHNAFAGVVPGSIGNLQQLESLDLSGNVLSGEIPSTLSNLTFLSFLNLSNNDLIGRIPQGNQLSTFSNSSFQGNKGLCGAPLSKQCDRSTTSTGTGEESGPSDSDSSNLSYMIGLALFIGLGFGTGITIVVVLQSVSWKRAAKFALLIFSNICKKLKKASVQVREEATMQI